LLQKKKNKFHYKKEEEEEEKGLFVPWSWNYHYGILEKCGFVLICLVLRSFLAVKAYGNTTVTQ